MVVIIVSRETSRLTISLENGSAARQKGIMLSESREFTSDNLKVMLEAIPVGEAWNISGGWLPNDIHTIDGNNSSREYFAYSFYLVNVGELDVNLTFDIKVKGTKGLDETIRVRIYLDDDVPITYAKRDREGNPEVGTIPFESNNTIVNVIGSLQPDSHKRVSIIIWIEGEDLDTTNDKMGGTISLDAKFKIME